MITRILFSLLLLTSGVLAQVVQTAKVGEFPSVRVQVTVGTQQRRLGDSYRKSMEINPKVVIEGAARLQAIPAAEATMLVITMDTAAKYRGGVESYKIHTAQTLPIPAATSGERRTFTFESSTVTYDSYRDSTNIGGQVYKYFIFGLRDAATKEIVDFETNNAGLAALCKTDPAKREEFLALKAGGKLPPSFK
jgi:hypothetical protein